MKLVSTFFFLFLLFASYEAQTQKVTQHLEVAKTRQYTPLERMVIDGAALFSSDEQAELNKYLQNLDKESAIQILVYTKASLNGKTLESYTMEIANEYGIGYRGINNGAGIFVFSDDKKVRVEIGLGMEWIISDKVSQEILNSMLPFFREGKFYDGIKQAAAQIATKNKEVDWQTYKLPEKFSEEHNGKIFSIKYKPEGQSQNYEKPSPASAQFSESFKIFLTINRQTCDLYYSKHNGTLIEKIQDDTERTIYFRLVDYKTKRLELLGVH